MRIRRAQLADAADVAALMDEAARWLVSRDIRQWVPGAVTVDQVEGWMAGGRVYLLDRVDPDDSDDPDDPDEQVVGCVRVAWTDPAIWGDQPPVAGYVHSLVVARSQAGRGVGARLLLHAEAVVAATGRPLVRLDHVSTNTRLATYYGTAGYAEVGRREFAPDSGWNDVTLREKALS